MKVLLLALLLTSCATVAEPLAQFNAGGVGIVLYDEPCATEHVKNLPLRVEWKAGGKTFGGCWGLNMFGLIVMYFEDLTVESIPLKQFSAAQGA